MKHYKVSKKWMEHLNRFHSSLAFIENQIVIGVSSGSFVKGSFKDSNIEAKWKENGGLGGIIAISRDFLIEVPKYRLKKEKC